MPGYEKIESLKNCGSWGQFCWETCGFERENYSCFYVSSEILFELGFPVFVLIEHELNVENEPVEIETFATSLINKGISCVDTGIWVTL